VIDRVLIAVDDSVESLAAARYGARLAQGWNAAVRLLTAVADESHAADARHLLEYVAKQMRDVATGKIDSAVRFSEAYEAILEEARTWPADVIVMAVSSRSGLRSPYVGSQTEHVLEFATCPVLVVPLESHMEQTSKQGAR
jgi:universal stress protein A